MLSDKQLLQVLHIQKTKLDKIELENKELRSAIEKMNEDISYISRVMTSIMEKGE